MPMLLSDVEQGCTARFLQVTCGRGLAVRLAAMGMLHGVEVKVIRNQRAGPLIVSVGGTRLMLGRGMSRHIMVE